MSTVVVVPCFNEAQRLATDSFLAYLDTAPEVRFVSVDDGSTAETAAVLEDLREARPDRVEIVSMPDNAGKAEAVRVGVCHALAADPDYVGYWDADLATPLASIALLRSVLDERPTLLLAMGARVKLLGHAIERRALRHYLGRVFATLASRTLGMAVYDTQCGAKLFRAGPEAAALFAEPFISRWIFDVEILARLGRHLGQDPSGRICEVPLPEWRDVAGSKVKLRAMVRAAFDLRRIRKTYRRCWN